VIEVPVTSAIVKSGGGPKVARELVIKVGLPKASNPNEFKFLQNTLNSYCFVYVRPVMTADVVVEYVGFKKRSFVPARRHPTIYENSLGGECPAGAVHANVTDVGETPVRTGRDVSGRAAGCNLGTAVMDISDPNPLELLWPLFKVLALTLNTLLSPILMPENVKRG
jgi:hypothetical protein